MGFPIVFFFTKNFLKKPNTPKYAQDLVVTWAKLNSVTALSSPPPNTLLVYILLTSGHLINDNIEL